MRFFIILVMLAVVGAGVVEWGNAAWDAPGLPAPSGNETVVMIKPHTRTHDIAATFEKKGLIKSGLLFELDLRLRGLTGQLKAGEYAIPNRASMKAIADILTSGKSIQHKLTVAEGLTSEMVWKLVQADKVLTGDAGPVPAEGTLLPETYLFTRGETRTGLLAQMSAAQQKFLRSRWQTRAANLPFKTIAQAVTLASIVEKETALPAERPHIAGLFINRLKVGMRLQSDPTIIYGLTRGYPLGRGIRASEIEAATPFNTYVIAGLPPTPIANPGKDAIAAVLNPQETDDLFFVATGKGGHVFSATISEHARNVAAFRAMERAAARQVQESERLATPDVTVPEATAPILPSANHAKAHRRRVRH
jgi:UPF0755 protein